MIVVAVITVVMQVMGGDGGGSSASASSLLEMVPEESVSVSIADLRSIREDVDLEEVLDISSPVEEIDIEEIDEYVRVRLETGEVVYLLEGISQFDDLRDDLDENGYQEDSYREYEVWIGPWSYALFEEEGRIVVSNRRDGTQEVLKTLYRGSGSLAKAEGTDLKRILDKLGDAPFVMAVAGDDLCSAKRCQGYGSTPTRYDISREKLHVDFVVLFSSERAAEAAEDDYDEVADFIERQVNLDVADTKSEGEFVVGTATRSYASAAAPRAPVASAPAAATRAPTVTPPPTELENMSNLEIARAMIDCGIENGTDEIREAVMAAGTRDEAARRLSEITSREYLIDIFYYECE